MTEKKKDEAKNPSNGSMGCESEESLERIDGLRGRAARRPAK